MNVAWDLCWEDAGVFSRVGWPEPATNRRSPHCNGSFDLFRAFLHMAVTWCFGVFGYKTHYNAL